MGEYPIGGSEHVCAVSAFRRSRFDFRLRMQNGFLRELNRWTLATVHEKLTAAERGVVNHIGASDLARMLADYVLLRVAENPNSCWNACELDTVTNEEILRATTFDEDLLAAGLIGAVFELNGWQGEDGVRFMVSEGVPPEDADEIAAAVEVVTGKLGTRGQALVQKQGEARAAGHPPPQFQASA